MVFEGEEITDPTILANNLNKYFCSVAENLEEQLPTANRSPISYMGQPEPNSFYLFDVTVSECLRIVSNLKLTRTSIQKVFKNTSSSFQNAEKLCC